MLIPCVFHYSHYVALGMFLDFIDGIFIYCPWIVLWGGFYSPAPLDFLMPSVHFLISSHPALLLLDFIWGHSLTAFFGRLGWPTSDSIRLFILAIYELVVVFIIYVFSLLVGYYLSRLSLFKFCYSVMVVEVTLSFFRDLGHFHLA